MAQSTDRIDTGASSGIEVTPVRRNVDYGQAQAPYIAAGNRTRWGPIWGGFVTAASTFVLMEMFVIWVGWVTIVSGPGGIAGTGREWITWIVAVIAFFLGGLVATLTSPVRGVVATGVDGFLVWGITTVLMVAASLAGAGLLFGGLGAAVTRILVQTPGHVSGPTNLGAFANDAQTAAFWAFITLITTAAAAVLGAWMGNMSSPIGHVDERQQAA